MTGAALAADPVDAAIAGIAAKEAAAAPQVGMIEVKVDFGPNRFVMMALPADISLQEVLGLAGFITAGGLAKTMAAATMAAGQTPQIEIARAMPMAPAPARRT